MTITGINYKLIYISVDSTHTFDHIMEAEIPFEGDDISVTQINRESVYTKFTKYSQTQETIDQFKALIDKYGIIGEQPNPWNLLQPQDVTSRHRGAKPLRRFELLGAISLLSPEYLLSYERWPSHEEPPDHFALVSHLLDLFVSQSSPLMPLHSVARLPFALSGPLEASVTLLEATTPVKLPTKRCPTLVVRPRADKGWYFTNDSTSTSVPASKSPTYPTHHPSKISAKL